MPLRVSSGFAAFVRPAALPLFAAVLGRSLYTRQWLISLIHVAIFWPKHSHDLYYSLGRRSSLGGRASMEGAAQSLLPASLVAAPPALGFLGDLGGTVFFLITNANPQRHTFVQQQHVPLPVDQVDGCRVGAGLSNL